MANLHIGEYSDIGSTSRGSIPIPLEPPRSEQSVEITAQSKQSDALSKDTCIVTLVSDADCVIAIGDDPDATNSVRHLSAGREKIITVAQGSNLKIAVAGKGSGSMSDSLGAFLAVVANPADAKKNLDALKAQAAESDKAAQALRVAADDHRKAKAEADAALTVAETSKADVDAGTKVLVAERNRLAADKAEQAAKVAADAVAAVARKQALDGNADGLRQTAIEVDRATLALADAKSKLELREKEIVDRENAVAKAEVAYAERLAKLKALTA